MCEEAQLQARILELESKIQSQRQFLSSGDADDFKAGSQPPITLVLNQHIILQGLIEDRHTMCRGVVVSASDVVMDEADRSIEAL